MKKQSQGIDIGEPSGASRLDADLAVELLDNASDLVAVLDKDFRYRGLNRAARYVVEADKGNVIDRLIWDVYPDLCGTEFERLAREAMHSGQQARLEMSYYPYSRSYNIRFIPIESGLAIYAMDTTAKDELGSQLHESEVRFHRLADEAPVLIWLADVEGDCEYVNRRWLEFTGAELDSQLGDGWLESLHPDDRESTLSVCSKAYAEVQPFRLQFRIRRADGEFSWFLNHGVPRFAGNGAFEGFIGSCIDINEQVELQAHTQELLEAVERTGATGVGDRRDRKDQAIAQEGEGYAVSSYRKVRPGLLHSIRRLRALSRSLLTTQESEYGNLARELHDDVGQAVTAIRVGLIKLAKLDADNRDEIERLIQITDALLGKVRGISMTLRPALLDELGLQAALRALVRGEAERAGLNYSCTFEPVDVNLPKEVEIVAYRIVQSAVTNVIRHAAASHVEVALGYRDGALQITVGDDGCGFDLNEVQEGIANGEHFGLLGMQERAEFAGGRLQYWSNPGEGAEVRAELPVARPGYPR